MFKAASFLVKSSMSATAPRTAQVNGPCVAWNRAICPQRQRQAVRCCPRPSWARREMLRIRGSEAPRVEDFLNASTKGVLDPFDGFIDDLDGIDPLKTLFLDG